MKITVISNIPGSLHLSGEYRLEQGKTISIFVQELGLVWNQDALVIVNEKIVNQDYRLENQDKVYLLIPIVGG